MSEFYFLVGGVVLGWLIGYVHGRDRRALRRGRREPPTMIL